MRPFTALNGIAAPLVEPNIDTDQIIPARYLKTILRTGLGKGLFADRRSEGGFILDRPPFDRAVIMIGGANFGCGSSREHAAWALLDFGIGCVIAPSFGDIFRANAVNNGLLPIALSPGEVSALAGWAERGGAVEVDLQLQVIVAGDRVLDFPIDPKIRADLLSGIDAIERSHRHVAAIETIEARVERAMPWLIS